MDQTFLPLAPHQFALSRSLCDDITLLNSVLGEVLQKQEGDWLISLARRVYEDDGTPATVAERIPELHDPQVVQELLRAFSIFFLVLNTAEQKEIIRVNRARGARDPQTPRPESIGAAVRRLHATGMTAAEMQELLRNISISPTLTAHPTEARRRAVQDKLQSLAAWLAERNLPAEAPLLNRPLKVSGEVERGLRGTLTALWETDEMRATRITVEDEVRNSLYFFEHTILDAVPWLHDDLQAALRESYPEHEFEIPPFIKFRSWVGGDRDGNPNVTPDVTWRTLLRHKRRVLRFYLNRLAELERLLTLSSRLVPVCQELVQSLQRDQAEIELPSAPLMRYAREPYALKLVYMQARVRATLEHLDALDDFRAEGPSFAAQPPAYARSSQFLHELLLLQRSLRAANATSLADEGPLAHLITQVRTFGFHLATLDVRQHSDEHAAVLDEMLHTAGLLPPGKRYPDLSEEEKVRLLTRELSNPRPLMQRDWVGSEQAQKVTQVFEVLRHARHYISPNAVSTYIISMTHGISDILEVLLLAKEYGLLRWKLEPAANGQPGQPIIESDLDIVPLFETVHDLEQCDSLMRRLFANPAYRRHLTARGNFQEVMLGYSDSSKDGGYLAANWALYDAQARLARVCDQAGICLQLFHGRGGTVGRGGGRANQAILSQPPGSFSGRIRFTEQGEIISFRYSLPPIAHRHLEQIANAVLLAAGERSRRRTEPRVWKEAMRDMAEISRQTYRALVYEDPDFWDFYRQATPISHISRLPIASRPVSRGGTVSGVQDLRAIPWVFAWVQSRFALPGWYGLGTALDTFAGDDPERLALLRDMYARWPFFRTVINNAQLELVRAHLPTAMWYAGRVQPPEIGARIGETIASKYRRTSDWLLKITGEEELLENAPVVRDTVELRNPLATSLSKLQVYLMDQWDASQAAISQEGVTPPSESPGTDPWRDAILYSIIGLAAAMQSTG